MSPRGKRTVRDKLLRERGTGEDTVVFSYGPLTFGFNLLEVNAHTAEAYLDLQQREIIGSFEDIKGKRVLVFEGDRPPNLLIMRRDGTMKPSYWPLEVLEAHGFERNAE